jgi:hypothetical protein
MSWATRVPRGRRAIPLALAAIRKVGPNGKTKACPTQGSSTARLRSRTASGRAKLEAEEAFLLYLRKKALDGNEAARERLEEIQAFRREFYPDFGSENVLTIVSIIVSPDNPNMRFCY